MSTLRILALLSLSAAGAAAQGPPQGPPPGDPGRGPGPAAQMLLAQTGELELTDAQVIKLAAIARRSEARRRAMRAAMDSGARRFQPGDTAARRQFGERMRADMQRAESQMQVDQRDAIAVLTPDQQAKAWNMVSNRGARRGGGGGGALRRGGGRGGALGRPLGREFRRRPMDGQGLREGRPLRAPRVRRPVDSGTGNGNRAN